MTTKKIEPTKEIDAAVEKVNDSTINLAAETLKGDIRTALLDRIRNMNKPWEKCSESEQKEINRWADGVAETLIRRAAKVIAADGRRTIVLTVDKVAVKDRVQATISCSRLQQSITDLSAAIGQEVLVVVADTDAHMGEREAAKVDPDQSSLLDKAREDAA